MKVPKRLRNLILLLAAMLAARMVVIPAGVGLTVSILPNAVHAASDTVIGFDDSSVTNGAYVADQYDSLGIRFGPAGRLPMVAAVGAQAHSPPNVLNITSAGEFAVAYVTGTFVDGRLRQHVEVFAGEFQSPTPTSATLTLTAYASDGRQVVQSPATTLQSGQAFNTRLRVDSNSVNIASFDISASDVDGGKPIGIDDLTFDNPSAPQPPDYALSAPPGITLLPGASVDVAITILRFNSVGRLQFAVGGLPQGVTSQFPPIAVGTSLTINLSAADTAPRTRSVITVTANPLDQSAGSSYRTAQFALVVEPNFTVSVDQKFSNISFPPCAVQVPIQVTRSFQFLDPITLSVTGVPPSVRSQFDPATLTFPGGVATQMSTLTLIAHDWGLSIPRTTIAVTGSSGTHPKSSTQMTVAGTCPAPFDLVWDAVDDNGIPKDPKWGYQVSHYGQLPDAETLCGNMSDLHAYPSRIGDVYFGAPPCTRQQISLDNSVTDVCAGGGRDGITNYHGHVNWPYAATYEGPIFWEEKADYVADDDYSFNLQTAHEAGLTDRNNYIISQRTIHVEFNADDTIDNFHTHWWDNFHSSVDSPGRAAGHAMVDGHEAIVTGLIGLDAAHSIATELHPVFGFAVNTQSPAARNPVDDVWAIFARNWGNEGFCSHDVHLLDVTAMSIRLPWWQGATSVSFDEQTTPCTKTCFLSRYDWPGPLLINAVPNQGIVITIPLQDASSHGRVNGELHLHWTLPETAVRSPEIRSSPSQSTKLPNAQAPARLDVEEMLNRAYASMTASQLKIFRSTFASQESRGVDRFPVRSVLERQLPRFPSALPMPQISQADTAELARKQMRALAALCAAFHNGIPGLREDCRLITPPAPNYLPALGGGLGVLVLGYLFWIVRKRSTAG